MSPTFKIGPQGPDVQILEDSLKNDDALSSLFSFYLLLLFVDKTNYASFHNHQQMKQSTF